MKKYKKAMLSRLKQETGSALIFVLILLMMGSITLIPIMSFMATSLASGQKYEVKTHELYTSDSGVEDGLWRIKYDYMGPEYDPYDFYGTYSYETELINGEIANVNIKNVWFPSNYTAPAAADDLPTVSATAALQFGTYPGNGLSLPTDVAVGADGRVYVVDSGRHRITYYDATSNPLGHFGAEGDGAEQLFIQVTQVSGGTFMKDSKNVQPFRWHVSVNNPADTAITATLSKRMVLPEFEFPKQTITLEPGEYRVLLGR